MPVKQSRLRVWVERVYAFDDWLYEWLSDSPSVFVVVIATWSAIAVALAFVLVVVRSMFLIVAGPIVAAVILVIPFALKRYRHLVKEQRRKAGQCLDCGYDLRESRERCPECGADLSASCSPLR